MRWFNYLFVLLFLMFAAFQYNDPDPWLWMTAYLLAGGMCAHSVLRYPAPALLLPGIVLYLAWAGYLLFCRDGVLDWLMNHGGENIASGMKPEKPWIEATREFFGLFIVVAALSVNVVWARTRKSETGR